VAEPITLYAIHGSHPCVTVEAGLRLKAVPFEVRYLQFGASQLTQMLRFGRRTVPGMTVGTQKVSGSRLILRALDGLVPDPPFLPSDPGLRAAVEEADVWADEVLEHEVRWIAVDALRRHPSAAAGYGSRSTPPLPAPAVAPAAKGLFTVEMRLLGHTHEQVRDEYLPALPGRLDHVDALIADGVLGGEHLNVADLQVAGSIRLLQTMEDLRPALDARPCGRLARRAIPHYDGSLPAGAMASPL
jgi:glutathione S-transferase